VRGVGEAPLVLVFIDARSWQARTRHQHVSVDQSGVNRQRTPGTSSSRVDGGKDTLPRAKIQALEQFLKFGRKGKQKDKDKNDQKAAEFPPPAWLNSTPISTTPASSATANTALNTAASVVPRHDNSSPLPLPRAPPQHPSVLVLPLVLSLPDQVPQ
jgi:hypothetical protein